MSSPFDLGTSIGEVSPSEAREVLEQGLQFQNLAEVHLATLNPYTSGKNGTHILSALKVVTGSESFLALSEDKKGCSNEDFEACQTRRYLLAVEQHCGCVPWLATFFLEHKVTASFFKIFISISILCFFFSIHLTLENSLMSELYDLFPRCLRLLQKFRKERLWMS